MALRSQSRLNRQDDTHRIGVLHVGAVTPPALTAVVADGRPLSGVTSPPPLSLVTKSARGMCMGQEHIG